MDITETAAMINFTNRLANALGWVPNPEGAEALRRWRFEQLVGLGFSHAESALLADGPVDLGYVRRLIASGCPLEMAFKILLEGAADDGAARLWESRGAL